MWQRIDGIERHGDRAAALKNDLIAALAVGVRPNIEKDLTAAMGDLSKLTGFIHAASLEIV